METANTATIVMRPGGGTQVAEELLSGRYDSGSSVPAGAPAGAMDAVLAYLRSTGLTIVEADAGARRIVVAGTPDQLAGSLTKLPAEIAQHVMAVLGLDKSPVAHPRE